MFYMVELLQYVRCCLSVNQLMVPSSSPWLDAFDFPVATMGVPVSLFVGTFGVVLIVHVLLIDSNNILI